MLLDILVYVLIGLISYTVAEPIFSKLPKAHRLSKAENVLFYIILWPITVLIHSIVIFWMSIDKRIDEERYVVKNKWVKIKRRKWF
jgi:hypothetical protein